MCLGTHFSEEWRKKKSKGLTFPVTQSSLTVWEHTLLLENTDLVGTLMELIEDKKRSGKEDEEGRAVWQWRARMEGHVGRPVPHVVTPTPVEAQIAHR